MRESGAPAPGFFYKESAMLALIEHLAGRPWAIRQDLALAVHTMVLQGGYAGLRSLADIKASIHAYDDGEDRPTRSRKREAGSIAVIPVIGTMTKRGDTIASARTRSTDEIAAEVESAVADSSVDSVILVIDSPGGEVRGVTEAHARIRAAAKTKPVIAFADGDMASAALWLGLAASEVWITPSGGAGSLGVYSLHVDQSKALEESGIKITAIAADDSPFKVEGAPWAELADEALAQRKKEVNRFMSDFVHDVAAGRGLRVDHVRKHFGKGRMLSPKEALEAKMVDHIGTFNDAVRRAAKLGSQIAAGAKAEEFLPRLMAEEPDGDGPPPEPKQPADMVFAHSNQCTKEAAKIRRRLI